MVRFLLFFVLAIVVARMFWVVMDGVFQGLAGQSSPRPPRGDTPGIAMARDPVCGTFVVPGRALRLVDGRTELYFCSTDCRDRYQASHARPA